MSGGDKWYEENRVCWEGTGRAGAGFVPWQVCFIQESISDGVTFEPRLQGGNEMPYANNLAKRIPGQGMNKWKGPQTKLHQVCTRNGQGANVVWVNWTRRREQDIGPEKWWWDGRWADRSVPLTTSSSVWLVPSSELGQESTLSQGQSCDSSLLLQGQGNWLGIQLVGSWPPAGLVYLCVSSGILNPQALPLDSQSCSHGECTVRVHTEKYSRKRNPSPDYWWASSHSQCRQGMVLPLCRDNTFKVTIIFSISFFHVLTKLYSLHVLLVAWSIFMLLDNWVFLQCFVHELIHHIFF